MAAGTTLTIAVTNFDNTEEVGHRTRLPGSTVAAITGGQSHDRRRTGRPPAKAHGILRLPVPLVLGEDYLLRRRFTSQLAGILQVITMDITVITRIRATSNIRAVGTLATDHGVDRGNCGGHWLLWRIATWDKIACKTSNDKETAACIMFSQLDSELLRLPSIIV